MRTYSRLGGLFFAVFTASALLLASCGPTPSAPTTQAPTTAAGPYGSLTIAGHFGTGHFDPPVNSGETFGGIGQAVYDTLLHLTYPDDQLIGGIAERWEIARDGMSHTFYIRKGIKFHNGDDLTGLDVKFSIERGIKPEATTQDAPVWRGVVARVELKDDYTVVVHMKTPQFEKLKGINSAMAAVMPKKYIEEKGVEYFVRNPVGSGPWRLVKLEPGSRVELQAVENHWRQTPQFKNLTLMSVTEEASLVAQLKTGELDMALVSHDSVPGLKAAGVRIVTVDRGVQYYLWPWYDVENPDKYPFGDLRVRKAAQLAINQKELADKLFAGAGGPIAQSFFSPSADFFDANAIKVDPYDPEGAKKLLAEAGYPNGFETRIYDVGGGGIMSTLNSALEGYWRKVGINGKIVPIAYSSWYPKMMPKTDPEIWGGIWLYRSSGNIDFTAVFPMVFHSKKSVPKNANNPRLDELIDKVPATADPVERVKLAREAAVLAKNGYTTLAVVEAYPNLAVSSKIGEVKRRALASIPALLYETITHAR